MECLFWVNRFGSAMCGRAASTADIKGNIAAIGNSERAAQDVDEDRRSKCHSKRSHRLGN
jgi:hypothetical protein